MSTISGLTLTGASLASFTSSLRGNIATAGGGSTGSSIATGGGAIETGGIEGMDTGRGPVPAETPGFVSDKAKLDVLDIRD